MVILKRTTERRPTGRRLLRPFDDATGGCGSRAPCKSALRSDQHSAISIVGSCSGSSDHPQAKTIGSSGHQSFLCRNTGACNSTVAAPNDSSSLQDCVTDETTGRQSDFHRLSRSSRRNYGTYRMGKTVSITTSQEARTRSDIDQTANSRIHLPSEVTTKSIIKLKQLSLPSHVESSANNMNDAPKDPRASLGMTPHQLKEQKIFRECRFLPRDTFYKKVLVTPDQERQFFAAPKGIRGPGSRLFYDISGDNFRHHQDCNIDFTRDMLRKSCSTYCRPSQFRHIY